MQNLGNLICQGDPLCLDLFGHIDETHMEDEYILDERTRPSSSQRS